jgi:hypothetical protein
MGDAQGELLMYRLTAEEAPPLSAFLADGTIEQDVRSTFED